MRIAVVGAGAIGGYLAARLALAGHETSVLARGAQLDARDARGLTALGIATEQKQDEVAKLLEQAGARR
jgi:ketopantoate reductase